MEQVENSTGGSRLMGISLVRISLVRISLVRVSLLQFFKTFHKYLPYANFGAFTSLVGLFWAKYLANVIFWLFISSLQFALC